MILSTDMSPVGTERRMPGPASCPPRHAEAGDRPTPFAATLEAAGLTGGAGEGPASVPVPTPLRAVVPAEAAETAPQQDLPQDWLQVLPAALIPPTGPAPRGAGDPAAAVKVAASGTEIIQRPGPDAGPGGDGGDGTAPLLDAGLPAALPEKGAAEAPDRREQPVPATTAPEEGAAFTETEAADADPRPGPAEGEPVHSDIPQAGGVPAPAVPGPRKPGPRPDAEPAPTEAEAAKATTPPPTAPSGMAMSVPLPTPGGGAPAPAPRPSGGMGAVRSAPAAPVAADPSRVVVLPEDAPTSGAAAPASALPDDPRARPAQVAADLSVAPVPDAAVPVVAAPSPAAPAPGGAPTMAAPLPGTAQPLDMMRPDWTGSIAMTLAELGAEGGTMIVDLAPEELGRMRITLTVEGERTTVQFQTDTPEAARLLSQGERQLALDLARGGMNLAGHEANPGGGWGGRHGRPQSGGAGADTGLPSGPVPAPQHRGIVNLIA